ncbi:MAG: hypothetical protein Q8M81_09470 [Sediminibacterium sp.]|nr:hypothetical protein [Sediminibacterium sp.]MDP3666642.1 hypothetical protein [Sediminibacterium sp.]
MLKPLYRSAFTRRLPVNKGASFGLILMALSLLPALLCYFIPPDSFP